MPNFFKSQSTEARRDLILHGPILNTLMMLSIPILLMNVVVSILPVIDGLFLNNLAGRLVASSVVFSDPIIQIMTALSQGLGVSAMAIVGQYNGIGDFKNAKKVSTQIVVFAALMGLAMSPILYIVSILVSSNLHEGIKENVYTYLSLYSFVIPMNFMAAIYNGIKNANGKPEATFIRIVFLVIFKIIFNFLYIFLFRMGVIGSVLSSFSTYILVTTWMFYDLFIKNSEDKLTLKGFKFDWGIIKEVMVIGVPSMLTTALANFGFFLINSEVEKYGPAILNAQGIVTNITAICFNLPTAFGQALTTMVSMNIGANYPDKARKSCYTALTMGIILSIVLIIIMIPLSPHITILFTRDNEVLNVANGGLPVFILSILGFAVTMIINGALIGLGRTRIPLITSVLRIWLFRFLFILATTSTLGYWSVFWGNLFSNTLAGIISLIIIIKTPWKSVLNIETDNLMMLKTKLFIDQLGAKIFPHKIGTRKDNKNDIKAKISNKIEKVNIFSNTKTSDEKEKRKLEKEERAIKREEEHNKNREILKEKIENIKRQKLEEHRERLIEKNHKRKEKEKRRLEHKKYIEERRENRIKLREERRKELEEKRKEFQERRRALEEKRNKLDK